MNVYNDMSDMTDMGWFSRPWLAGCALGPGWFATPARLGPKRRLSHSDVINLPRPALAVS